VTLAGFAGFARKRTAGGRIVSDRWMLRGPQFGNCNCAYGCPCQFGSPTTNGFCEAITAVRIAEGFFNDVRLDGLSFIVMLQWPGEIAQGNGRCQAIVDERADPAQREALDKILRGESTAPGATHFSVFASTMRELLDTIYAPIECEVDVDKRTARVHVPDLIDARGAPIIDPHSGKEFRAGIGLPNGFEYRYAEMGSGTTSVRAGLAFELKDSYGQFYELNMNQDGVIC
jgi:hypothetical protein